MADLITQSEIARRAGVAPASINKALKPGKALAPAIVGKKIDADHPAAIAYIASKTGSVHAATTKPATVAGHRAKSESRKMMSGHAIDPEGIPDNIQEFADWTIREIIAHFGTDYRFVDYLRALKDIEVIDERRIKNAKAKGELVNRDLIAKGIIEPIDSAHRKMLTDGSKTIARRSVAMAGAGKEVEEVEKFVAEQISSFIKPAKAKIKRTLENVGN